MELMEAIRRRRSIRKYENKPVEDEKIWEMLEAARWAPNAGNTQTWRFFVVKKDDIKKKLSSAALNQRHIWAAPVDIVVGYDIEEIYRFYRERGVELYAIQDSAAAIQNMLLSAYSLGLASCWVGAFDEEEVAKILDLPQKIRPVAIVAVGYPAEKEETRRKPLEDVVEFYE